MRIVQGLREEHRLIEQVAGSLVTFVRLGAVGSRPQRDARALLRLLRVVCRPVPPREGGEPSPRRAARRGAAGGRSHRDDRGEHAESRADIAALRVLADASELDDPEHARLEALATRYCARLWEHIDKEDSVLFPEIRDPTGDRDRTSRRRARLVRETECAPRVARGFSARHSWSVFPPHRPSRRHARRRLRHVPPLR